MRLTNPLGNAARSMQFVGEGDSLLLGDDGGLCCLFDLKSRRSAFAVSPSSLTCLKADAVAPPMAAANFSSTSNSPVLHIEPLYCTRSSCCSRVLIQQKDSRISVFDLESQRFTLSFKTGSFSFCECASPQPKSSKSSDARSSSGINCVGEECVAAPVAEIDTIGLFDARASTSWHREKNHMSVVSPALKLKLPPNSASRFASQEQKLQEPGNCGSVQGLGFAASECLLLAAYELPLLALWDVRNNGQPLALLPLATTSSPPAYVATVRNRVWTGCIEGDIFIHRVASQKGTDSQSLATAAPTDEITAAFLSMSSERRDDATTMACGSRRDDEDCFGILPCLTGVAHVNAIESVQRNRVPSYSHFDLFNNVNYLESMGPSSTHLTCVSVRGDGLLGACGTTDGAVLLLEGKHLKPLGSLGAHHSGVSAAAWCSHSGGLATGDKQGVVYLWSVYADSYTSSF